jgi:hypothetical protein
VNAHRVDNYLVDLHKACGHCYQFELSVGWFVELVAYYRGSKEFYCRYVCDNLDDFGVLHFPMRDLPCRD